MGLEGRKSEVGIGAKRLIRPALVSGSKSMKRLGVFLPPPGLPPGFIGTPPPQNCSSCRKLLLFYHCNSCYCFRASGIVSVVCSIVLSMGSKTIM